MKSFSNTFFYYKGSYYNSERKTVPDLLYGQCFSVFPINVREIFKSSHIDFYQSIGNIYYQPKEMDVFYSFNGKIETENIEKIFIGTIDLSKLDVEK